LVLIAQELQQVIPEVVRDWEYRADEISGQRIIVPSARLGVMYDDLIPVLVKSIQDQQAMIADLQNRVAVLETAGSKNSVFSEMQADKPLLEQNVPNPFSGSTTIRFSPFPDATAISIQVSGLDGKLVKTFFPAGNEVTIHMNDLPPGSYFYSLIVDGQKLDTKKMTIVR
jgi:hypothetical protein